MSTDKVTETRRMYTKDGRRISDNMRYSPDTTRAERRAADRKETKENKRIYYGTI